MVISADMETAVNHVSTLDHEHLETLERQLTETYRQCRAQALTPQVVADLKQLASAIETVSHELAARTAKELGEAVADLDRGVAEAVDAAGLGSTPGVGVESPPVDLHDQLAALDSRVAAAGRPSPSETPASAPPEKSPSRWMPKTVRGRRTTAIGGGIAILVVVALVLVFTLGSGGKAPTPTPTTTTHGTTTTFSAAESALLTHVPSAIAASCQPYTGKLNAGTAIPGLVAGVQCFPTAGGAIIYSQYSSTTAMNSVYQSIVITTMKLSSTSGTANSCPEESAYTIGGKVAGRVACGTPAATGQVYVFWTSDSLKILSVITNTKGSPTEALLWTTWSKAGPLS